MLTKRRAVKSVENEQEMYTVVQSLEVVDESG